MQEAHPVSEVEEDLNGEDLSRCLRLVHAWTGSAMGPEKRPLLISRLVPILKRRNLACFDEYLRLLERASDEGLKAEFVNAVTTHHTFFMREPRQLEAFSKWLRGRGKQALSVWSAACSTGEEPWTLAALLEEAGCLWSLLGTDLSADAVAAARQGSYDHSIQATFPLHGNVFTAVERGERAWVEPKASISAKMSFQTANLLNEATWPKGQFDVIFCRNVLIYFRQDDAARCVAALARRVREGGLLVVGTSEAAHLQGLQLQRHGPGMLLNKPAPTAIRAVSIRPNRFSLLPSRRPASPVPADCTAPVPVEAVCEAGILVFLFDVEGFPTTVSASSASQLATLLPRVTEGRLGYRAKVMVCGAIFSPQRAEEVLASVRKVLAMASVDVVAGKTYPGGSIRASTTALDAPLSIAFRPAR